MNKNIDDILEELSYSMATPEAQEFHLYIQEKKFSIAKKCLLEHTDEETASFVVNYFKKLKKENVKLVEIKVNDIPQEESSQQYIFRVGKDMYCSRIYENIRASKNQDKYGFYTSGAFLDLSKADQAWRVENQ